MWQAGDENMALNLKGFNFYTYRSVKAYVRMAAANYEGSPKQSELTDFIARRSFATIQTYEYEQNRNSLHY